VDADILHCLVGVALSVSKMTNDIRYLQSIGEIEEPFGKKQIGSSAMAYKRNPMRCERADSLARLILSLATSPQMTAATQFLERTLDDSANRRIAIPEAFLSADAILTIVNSVATGLVVYPKVIQKRLDDNLPLMATEAVIMLAVSRGGNRQEIHERIRTHSMEAVKQMRNGGKNNLLDRMADDTAIGLTKAEITDELDPLRFAGRAPQQTEEYIKEVVRPRLKKYRRYFPVDDATVKY
jgi:adenylosuccinate lyase